MFQRLFGKHKKSKPEYASLLDAARTLKYSEIMNAIDHGLNLDYQKSKGDISALQILAQHCNPDTEVYIFPLIRKAASRKGKHNKHLIEKFNAYRQMFAENERRRKNEYLLNLAQEDQGTVPRDEEGFIISYDVSDKEGMQKFFSIYGFVVVCDVLDKAECKLTIDEIWETHVEMSGGIVKRDDQTTWDKQWPGLRNEGIGGGTTVIKPQFVRNRCNPKIYQVASVLLSEYKLLTNIDRFGIFRPSKDRPEWKTTRNLHLDLNPVYWYESEDAQEETELLNSLDYTTTKQFIRENNIIGTRATEEGKKVHIQGLINLAENREEDGGFLICPRVHAQLETVIKERIDLWREQFGSDNRFCVIPENGNEDIHKLATRVTARAGSLIFWSQLSPHGSAPNNSERFRYAQYIKMFSASTVTPNREKKRKSAIKKLLKEEHIPELSKLGKKIHGLKKW
jgi:hypothetical protein